MNLFVDPITSEVFGYEAAQVAAGIVKDGLVQCAPRPSMSHVWQDGWVYVAPPVMVPQSVTMRQARAALIARGQFATVNDHLTGMLGIDGQQARNEWEYSQTVERVRPLTAAMGQLIGLDAAGMDEWFVFATTL